MRALVLGGCGFIGSHLVDSLLEAGHEVAVVDRQARNLDHLSRNIEFIQGLAGDRDLLTRTLPGRDVVYCLANSTHPAASWDDPLLEINGNLANCLEIFRQGGRAGVQKIVFASSGGTIYGASRTPLSEEALPSPVSPHGIVSLAIENFLMHYAGRCGFAYDIFRVANVYGPRQSPSKAQGVVAVWMDRIARGRTIEVFGDNTTLRDYIYVKDLARLMIHSIKCPQESGTYNLSSGQGTSILELLSLVENSVTLPVKSRLLERRESDNRSIVLDNRKILSRFPGYSLARLEEKLPETWEYYLQAACSP